MADKVIQLPGEGPGKQVEIRTKWVVPEQLVIGDILIEPNATVNAAILTEVYECTMQTLPAMIDAGIDPQIARNAVSAKWWRIQYQDPHAEMGSFVPADNEVEIEQSRTVL